MKREQYDALVKRVEAYAAAHPAAYAMRVVLLAALGYVYAGLMLLVAFAVVAGVSWLTFRASHSQFSPLLMTIAVLGATLLVTGRVLWVRFPAPGGVRLRAGAHAHGPPPDATAAPHPHHHRRERRGGTAAAPRAVRMVSQLPLARPATDADALPGGVPGGVGARARAPVAPARAVWFLDLPNPRDVATARGATPGGARWSRYAVVPDALGAVLQRLHVGVGAEAGVRR